MSRQFLVCQCNIETRRTVVRILLVASLGVLLASNAFAATKTWNAGSGAWSVSGNWSPTGVPAADDGVNIVPTDGAARTITYDYAGAPIALGGLDVNLTGPGTDRTTLAMSSGALTNIGFIIGDTGRATFNQTGGTFTQNNASFDGAVGYNAGGAGIYNLSGTGALSVAKDFYIGNATTSAGTVNQSGGTATMAHDLRLGYSGGTGNYTISGGNLSIGNNLIIGSSGTGMRTIGISSPIIPRHAWGSRAPHPRVQSLRPAVVWNFQSRQRWH